MLAGSARTLRGRRGTRGFAVVAWGLNSHGQCGVPSHSPVLTGPQEVGGALANAGPLSALLAGTNHSAALTPDGEAYTFGDGSFGKLGLGRTDPSFLPSRVENLVGRVHIVDAALGAHSSLFLDDQGHVHACGVSSDGGFDAVDLEVEAARMRSAGGGGGGGGPAGSQFGGPGGAFFSNGNGGRSGGGGGSWAAAFEGSGGTAAAAAAAREAQASAAAAAASQEPAWVPSGQLVPLIDHRSRAWEISSAQQLYSSDVRSLLSADSSALHYDAAATTGLLGVTDPAAHRFSVPIRLGAAVAALRTPSDRVIGLAACGATGGSVALADGGLLLLLKVPRRWAAAHSDLADRHAALLLPTPPCDLLTEVLSEHGGATKVVAGAGFFAALTASGKAVLWINQSLKTVVSQAPTAPLTERHGPVLLRAQGDTLLAVYDGLLDIKHIEANHTTLVMSDGEAVWVVRVHSPEEEESLTEGGGPASEWKPFQPRRVLRLAAEGVASLAAGGRAVAAVSGAGRLWLWGAVLSPEQASKALARTEEQEGYGHWAHSASTATVPERLHAPGRGPADRPRWPGLGAREPTPVPGLHKVQRVALGESHALVEVL